MRNVFRIFRHDLYSLSRHFFAFLIIIAICILPALYAWFNIYAYWDPYGKTGNIKIAVVSDDKDYLDADGNIVNMGSELVKELRESDHIGYVFLDDADKAVNGVYDGTYYAAVIIEEDFTYNMYNFLSTDMFKPTIKFYQNEKTNAIAVKIVEAAADDVKAKVNEKYIQAIVETLFGKLNAFSSDVQGDTSAEFLKNTLIKIRDNLGSYNSTIDQFIEANNALINTLRDTNNTLGYSIYLIGNERINISDQIYYIEQTQGDLALFNEEMNNLLLGLQDSVQEAIYKLDRLYNGNIDDAEAAKEALAELERQYQELIDYIEHSGLTGDELDDALSALNKLVDKITELRKKLGLDGSLTDPNAANQIRVLAQHNKDAIKSIKSDFDQVAVPALYKAITGYDYDDLADPSASKQNIEGLVAFMSEDSSDRIDSIRENIAKAAKTKDKSERDELLYAAKSDAAVVEQEIEALSVAYDAISSADNAGADASVKEALDSTAKDTRDVQEVIDDILNGNRDIDLVRDLQIISDVLGSARVTLTEVIYPAIDTMLDNLQDTLGDLSSLLLELNGILGKTQPIIDQLSNTFGTVNNALIQVKDLLSSYISRLDDFIDILNGDTDDDKIQAVLDFFNVDPASIGSFLASPVAVESDVVFPVESYGAAMAPFYTMLAIWVGCVILNAILKADQNTIELAGATGTQKFFGRYLSFFLLSQVQTLIIIAGDLVIMGVDCVHPGLFLLAGFFTSLTCSMLAYSFAVAFGNIGKAIFVVIMIMQIAGSGGSYPIELLPGFFQQAYLFFPFPYAINAMREAIAGLYQNNYLIYTLQLLLFFAAGLFIGLVLRRSLSGLNKYMDEQLEKTEMM